MPPFFRHHRPGLDGQPISRCRKTCHFAAHALFGLVAVIVIAALFGWVVMWAWNAVIPPVFNLPTLNFVQAVALLVLGRLLTGRFSHGHHRSRDGKCGWSRWGRKTDLPDGSLYADWWWEEGETAFAAYQARRKPDSQA